MSEILRINFWDEFYGKTLALRQRILRDPLGMVYNDDELKRDEQVTYFIFVADGEVHGCVGFVPENGTTARLLQMAVDDKLQGQNIGRRLVTELENYAKAEGFSSIILDARYVAKEFYLKMGYEEFGEIYQKIGLKHIDMKKSL